MAELLYLVAGVAIGLLAGFFLGRRPAGKQSVESPAQSEPAAAPVTDNAVAAPVTEDVDQPAKSDDGTPKATEAGSLNGAVVTDLAKPTTASVPATSGEPTTPLSAEPEPVTVVASTSDPIAETKVPVDAPEPTTAPEPADEPAVASEPADEPAVKAGPFGNAEPVPAQRAAEPVAVTEPAIVPEPVAVPERVAVPEPFAVREPVAVSEPVAAPARVATPEPVAAVPGAAESGSVLAEPAPIAVSVTEPDDLTKIAGIGPKTAMALAAGGITTFRQVADADPATLRAAVVASGLRSAPGLATWPEKARHLVGTAV